MEQLNVGTIVGLPTAIAAYFWANRLLPLDMTNRAEWEVHAMFIVWVLMLGHAALRSVRQAWLEQLWIAAGAFLLLPVLNALTTDRHLAQSLSTGDWIFAGFDLTVLGIGLILAWTAGKIAVSTNPLAKPTYTTFHATRTPR